jgi:UDP-N-acetylmuramoyl-L-alanyl-D-glutamate--2,6-diaminopimelate ligase
VVSGASGPTVSVEVDRRTAIEKAIGMAMAGDVVLILGKGHEIGQEVRGGEILPFDDRAVAREILAARSGSAGFGPDSGSMRP